MKRVALLVLAMSLLPLRARADDWTLPQKIWFGAGNGRPYARQMAYVDMTVSLGVTLVEAISWAPTLRVSGAAESPLPTMIIVPLASLAAPITHFVHGRIVPGILSLLGWAGVDFVVAMSSFATSLGGDQHELVRANLLTSFAGETLMTIFDTLMASGSPDRR